METLLDRLDNVACELSSLGLHAEAKTVRKAMYEIEKRAIDNDTSEHYNGR